MLVINDGCGCDSDVGTKRVAYDRHPSTLLLLFPFLRKVRGMTD